MNTALTASLSTNLLQPTAAFRSEAMKAIFAIVAFVIVYFLLFAFALLLAAICMYAGVQIIIRQPGTLTLIIGAGLIGLGIMVFIFLIKFLFESNKADVSDSIQITEAEQPRLVAFIHSIAMETRTPKPKKIFISHDVNASVFYNSSFWSMFLPVKKNLKIGLGLVNALNVSEFKAVIAHEFGHFSQRSMKLGSFVYNVNHVIFNMLYKNNTYSKTLQGFASVHGIFFLFARITAYIVQGIQWVLRQMYKIMNVCYYGLSRQMEFHADLVSSTVSGSNNIISSLRRLEIADTCFNATLATYDKLWKENKRGTNLYEDHRSVLQHFSTANNYTTESGLPVLPGSFDNTNEQRVNIKNQWASHPTTKERKEYLDGFDLHATVDCDSAWSLIDNAENLKQQLTGYVYNNLDGVQERTALDNNSFQAFYSKNAQSLTLPVLFGNYYDNRLIDTFDIEEAKQIPAGDMFNELFTDELQLLPRSILSLDTDVALLKAIESKEIDTRTFDFNGTKYSRKEAGSVCTSLEAELEVSKAALAEADKKIFAFFYKKSGITSHGSDNIIEDKYRLYFLLKEKSESHLLMLQDVVNLMGPVFGGQEMSYEAINALILRLKQDHEPKLKEGLVQWMKAGAFENNNELKKQVDSFILKDNAYFSGTSYFDHELSELNEMIQEGWGAIHLFLFDRYKELLEEQARLAA